MDPTVSLESSSVSVTPGSQAHIGMTIRNTGNRVQRFRFEVLGQAAPWTTVHPPEIPVYPDADVTVSVVLAPPSGPGAPAGNIPFGVRVVSALEDDDSMAVAQGTVDIGSVDGLQVSLKPVEASGRWSTRHKAEVANWGNAPLSLAVSAVDDNNRLGFLVQPDHVQLPVGARQDVSLRVRVREPVMRGNPTRHPFRLIVAPASADGTGAEPGAMMSPGVAGPPGAPRPGERVINGAVTQKPILTKTVVTLAVAAVALIAVGAVALARGNKGPSTNNAAPPASPTGFTVKSVDPTHLQAEWASDPAVTAYQLNKVTKAGAISGSVPLSPPTETVATISPGPGSHCYSVVAVSNGVSSNPTAPACVTTGSGQTATGAPGAPKSGQASGNSTNVVGPGGPNGSGSGGPSGSGSPSGPAPNVWAAALFGGNAPSTVLSEFQHFSSLNLDHPVLLIDSSQMKTLVDRKGDSENRGSLQGWQYVVAGSFTSADDARNWCQSQTFPADPINPDPCLVQVGSNVPFGMWPTVPAASPSPTSSASP
jgi:hypothetical protein